MPKISSLTSLTAPAAADTLPIVDADASTTKKITYGDLASNFPTNTIPVAAIASGAIAAIGHTLAVGATDVTATAAEVNNICGGMTKSTDGTFATNSDALYPTEKATKTYVGTATAAVVSDAAYGAGWDTVTTIAPSKNAVYDKLATLGTAAFLNVGTSASQVVQLNASAQLPAVDGSLLTSIGSYGYIYGLAMANDTDTEHDISITIGVARDDTDVANIVLSSAIVKRADAAWAVGTTNGGMDTGSIPTSGTLHVWLIKRSDTGVVDALFSISATSPTMPANYDYKRRIGAYRTDSSANIINGDWWGSSNNRTFIFKTPVLDVSDTSSSTSAETGTLSVPGGIIVKALINASGIEAGVGTSDPYFSSPNSTDVSVSLTANVIPSAYMGQVQVFTDTSSQIRYRCVNASNVVYISTLGWEESL